MHVDMYTSMRLQPADDHYLPLRVPSQVMLPQALSKYNVPDFVEVIQLASSLAHIMSCIYDSRIFTVRMLTYMDFHNFADRSQNRTAVCILVCLEAPEVAASGSTE